MYIFTKINKQNIFRRMNFQRKHDELESKIQTLNSEIIKFNNATLV